MKRSTRTEVFGSGSRTTDYLKRLGVPQIPPATSPFDPGCDPLMVESHLEQSAHLISILKLSMACWIVASEKSTRRKVTAAKRYGIPTVTGGEPFEIAVSEGALMPYLDLCADIGVTRIECGQGFTDSDLDPRKIVMAAKQRGLEVQMELGRKHAGRFDSSTVQKWIDHGYRWMDAGAVQLVVEGRESACDVGLFDETGILNTNLADRFVEAFGFAVVVFEAPTRSSQFALLNHFGRGVHLANVRLEELLRVEIYRRGLHSDAYLQTNLRPCSPSISIV
jgi:phosphosulfolactate synthase